MLKRPVARTKKNEQIAVVTTRLLKELVGEKNFTTNSLNESMQTMRNKNRLADKNRIIPIICMI